jgi:predicted transcriptional regulator
MYTDVDMSGKPINEIMEVIFVLLKREKEMSIRQLSIHVGSQWITIEKALNSMKNLDLVKEKLDSNSDRKTRLFSLK